MNFLDKKNFTIVIITCYTIIVFLKRLFQTMDLHKGREGFEIPAYVSIGNVYIPRKSVWVETDKWKRPFWLIDADRFSSVEIIQRETPEGDPVGLMKPSLDAGPNSKKP